MEDIIAKRAAIAKNCAENTILHSIFNQNADQSTSYPFCMKANSPHEFERKKPNDVINTNLEVQTKGTPPNSESLGFVRSIIQLKSLTQTSNLKWLKSNFENITDKAILAPEKDSLGQDSGFFSEGNTEKTLSEQFLSEKTNNYDWNTFNKKDDVQLVFKNLLENFENIFMSEDKIFYDAMEVLRTSSEADEEISALVQNLIKCTIENLKDVYEPQVSVKKFRIIQEISKNSMFTLTTSCFVTAKFAEIVQILLESNFRKAKEEEMILVYSYHLLDSLKVLLQDLESSVSASILSVHNFNIKLFWDQTIYEQFSKTTLLECLTNINSILGEAFVKLSKNHLMANILLFVKECISCANHLKKCVKKKSDVTIHKGKINWKF